MNEFQVSYNIEDSGTGEPVNAYSLCSTISLSDLEDLSDTSDDALRQFLASKLAEKFAKDYVLGIKISEGLINWARAALAERERMEDTGPSALTAAERNPTMGAQ